MEKKDSTPMWVFLAFSSIETRKGACILTLAMLLFTLVFLPLPLILDDWSWIDVRDWSGVTLLITIWYWLALRWVDKNQGWGETATVEEKAEN